MRILTNHLGYDAEGPKSALVEVPSPGAEPRVELLSLDDDSRVRLVARPTTRVDAWRTGAYSRVDFDEVDTPGRYALLVSLGDEVITSSPFTIGVERLAASTLSDLLFAFKSGRSSGEIERKDAAAFRYGDDSGVTVDARGGWLDASGDTSKFLSHLTYTPTMSPQQIPLCAWAFLEARDRLAERHPRFHKALGARLRDEALYGADFLVRFRTPDGAFYSGIFDALTKRLEERVITAPLPECVRTDRYRASYRGGGGLAIAALARASRETEHGDFTSAEYLAAAIGAFDDLEARNTDYLFGLDLDTGTLTDSSESIVDDYCALLAATELAAAADGADVARFVAAADRRAAALIDRYRTSPEEPGWFEAWEDGRPFFSAVEAGLPVIALLRYAEVVPGARFDDTARELSLAVMQDVLRRTQAVGNPFGYPRQRVQPRGGHPRDAFFFPHDNDTGYWWQGENATLGSLAFAALAVADLPACAPEQVTRLRRFAADQVHWVLGRNPFDVCMLQGRGRNNVEYTPDFPNLPGGIVNGITSDPEDESGIAFLTPDTADGPDSWRWAEQWIPHSAWFLLAVSAS
ncbi:glycoside hydrolase family 9 protein [Microbacterium paraoxydans]|uniref:Glycoside hydrolase family 9 protein n=1 Tax=Microbacterium paraoxydans TaxID=199592 RepID=A0ABS5IM41_9MICO|nr:glycoside hydrolase family 9 protein [Microbacterium paraoxydans]MBS0024019.1 glycoside hydrolase family 9 protein [Microbacterium paraoxydans]